MNWLHALILGLVQGCTEFFPVSSSAHLQIVKAWLHVEESVFFDLACHVGTLLVLVIYFRKDIWDLLLHPKKMIPYIVALLPLIPVYFLLKSISQLHYLSICLFITALILFAAQRMKKGTVRSPSWKDALWIGAFQSIALIPGISRSASTITGGIWRGLRVKEAVRFSFILSIPAVAGGAFLEMLKISDYAAVDWSNSFIGLAVSAIVGFGAIQVAIPILEKGIFRPFAWYCLIVAILLTII
jgi:undecaprenyl-diphosphatase